MAVPSSCRLREALITVFALTAIGSAEEPLVTDRPTVTVSARTVGSGVLQFEGGVTFSSSSNGNEVTTVGEIHARWGASEKLELRLVLPSYSRQRDGLDNGSGFLDLGIGFKYELAQGDGDGFIGGMEAAVIASTTVPTGTSIFASSEWRPLALLSTSWELGPNIGIGSNLGVGRPANDDDRYTTLLGSVVLMVGVSDAASIFFELYGFDREEARGPNTVTFQTGILYLITPDGQLDARVARRLTRQGVDFLIGAGLSWRLGG